MQIIVITGGLGSGKSTAAAYLRDKGATVISLDDVAARLAAPGSELLSRLGGEFGDAVVTADGTLDRQALARLGFESTDAARRLNAIVHPAVAAEVGPAISDLRLLPFPPQAVVLEVPLLVEAPVFAELADEVVAISAPEEVRLARAAARGMAASDVAARIRCQASDADREALATFVIENAGPVTHLYEELERFWARRVEPVTAP